MSRPQAGPGLVAALRERVPARVAKRLEGGNPAEAWTWEPSKVVTDSGEVVTMPASGPVGPDDLSCSCLLAPRCLHVLAVGAALPAGADEPAAPVAAPEPPPPPPEPKVALDGGQLAVVAATGRAASAVVFGGAGAFGVTAQEGLKRAVHGARAVGLHRLARAGTRLLREVRELQRERPEFTLGELVDALREVLLVAQVLGAGTAGASWVGTGRQVYEPVGHLRLLGLCTEPVIAGTGQAGVTSWLADERGRVWSIGNVQPGGPDRARSHYDAAVGTGGATFPHRELNRAGLFLQDATATSAGRIGTGGGVRAARSGGAEWTDARIASLWTAPLAGRLRRAREGLLFVEGVLVGVERGAPVLLVDGWGPVRLVAPSDHAELAFRDNLQILGRATGLSVRLIGRRTGQGRQVAVLAVGPGAEGSVRLTLPPEWSGRCNLGFDRLIAAHIEGISSASCEVELPSGAPDPLSALRRRVARVALGGRRTLPGEARGEVEREADQLRRSMWPTAADALLSLADATAPRAGDLDAVRRAWLTAAVFEQAASARLAE